MGVDTGAPRIGLGLDAGGTQTRWALSDAKGRLLGRGSVAGFSGQQAHTAAGRRHLEATFGALRHELRARLAAAGEPAGLVAAWAGVSGHDAAAGPALARILAGWLGLDEPAVCCFNDVELLCRLGFAPGEGGVVYAGTGSIAWFVDAAGRAHSVGGRGGLIGDEGSGYWIAKRALAEVWRREDDAPGSGAGSVLGRQLFGALGGSSWDRSRRALAAKDRGELGQLALAVAAAAREGDACAAALLDDAGTELARLAALLARHHGVRRITLAGRVFELDPRIGRRLRAALPETVELARRELEVAEAAARQAALAGRLSAGG
jgi:N-acetylglucosamine kinase-like BadF-type ATPase